MDGDDGASALSPPAISRAEEPFYLKRFIKKLEAKIEVRINKWMSDADFVHDFGRHGRVVALKELGWVLSELKVFRERFSAEKGSKGAKA